MLNWEHCFQNRQEPHVFFKEYSLSGYDQHPSPRPQPDNFSQHHNNLSLSLCGQISKISYLRMLMILT
jgi:hypothetical protein